MESVDWKPVESIVNQSLDANSGKPRRLLVCIDDEVDLLAISQDALQSLGYEIKTYSDPKVFLSEIDAFAFRVVGIISDLTMPGMDGLDLRGKLLEKHAAIPFLVLSGNIPQGLAMKGIEMKISAFIDKPIQVEEFRTIVAREIKPRVKSLDEDAELMQGFVTDAEGLLEEIEAGFLELESNLGDIELINRIFGMIHTIKGSSGFFSPPTLHQYAHQYEELITKVKRAEIPCTNRIISVFLRGLDFIKILVQEFKNQKFEKHDSQKWLSELNQDFTQDNSQAAAPPRSTEPTAVTKALAGKPSGGGKDIRVSAFLLDEFMQVSGEMTVIKNLLNKVVRTIDRQNQGSREMVQLNDLLEEMHLLTGRIQGKVEDLRKVPFKSIIQPLNRMCRDIATSLKKEVQIRVKGEDMRVDSAVGDVLSAGLVHMLRNSLDHGIEDPVARESAGKPRIGTIEMNCGVNNTEWVIEILDDGKGINPQIIRKKLVEKKLRTEDQVKSMSDGQVREMIFDPGFSTADQVSTVSGRGVGMNVVKEGVESLGGHVVVESVVGKGTHFKLRIPIQKSVQIMNCLFVSAGKIRVGIPEGAILRILKVEAEINNRFINHHGVLTYQEGNQILPVVILQDVFEDRKNLEPRVDGKTILVVKNQSGLVVAIAVDTIFEMEDTVIKALAPVFKKIGIFMGATFLEENGVGLILDVTGVTKKMGIGRLADQTKAAVRSVEEVKVDLRKDYLLFELHGSGRWVIAQQDLFRFEEFRIEKFKKMVTGWATPYRESQLTLVPIESPLGIGPREPWLSTLKAGDAFQVIVLQIQGRYLGIPVKQIHDAISAHVEWQKTPQLSPLIEGVGVIHDRLGSLLNVAQIYAYAQEDSANLGKSDQEPLMPDRPGQSMNNAA